MATFRIEGNEISFEVLIESGDLKREALVRMEQSQWTISDPKVAFGQSYLASNRLNIWDVIGRAVLHVMVDLENAQLQARTHTLGG